ncbi:MAG: hypothetical protein A3E77_11020 [Sphingopyxis sp. RIFCSPHIGHO2_12_FULL_65_19]|nr:MAG: hypothetical protein A3E77_11020 [Sphingopyxis sp. RIFCSPHIGHO2_12_FULL_65_19]
MPHFLDGPSKLLQFGSFLSVAFSISLDLLVPETQIGFWELADPTAVTVPKAAVNKNSLTTPLENDVGLTRQFFAVQAKSVA